MIHRSHYALWPTLLSLLVTGCAVEEGPEDGEAPVVVDEETSAATTLAGYGCTAYPQTPQAYIYSVRARINLVCTTNPNCRRVQVFLFRNGAGYPPGDGFLHLTGSTQWWADAYGPWTLTGGAALWRSGVQIDQWTSTCSGPTGFHTGIELSPQALYY